MTARNRTHEVPERLLMAVATAIAKGINEGAYETTVGGNEYHQRLITEINQYIEKE